MKKFLAIVVALTMVFAMSAFAFAEGQTGSITVENAKDDADYNAYKIFDLEIVEVENPDEDNIEAYFYTIAKTSKWYNVVKDYADVAANDLALEASGDVTDLFIIRAGDDFDAVKFAEHLKDNIPDDATAIVLPVEDGVASKDELELGYYFVTSSVGVVTALTTTQPNATIIEKNPFNFDKTEANNNYDLGDAVEYTVSVTIPGTDGYDNTDENAQHYIYKFTDHMTDGLDFNDDIVVTIVDDDETVLATLTKDVDYTVDYDADVSTHDFVIDFVGITTDTMQNHVGKTLVITYSATLNEAAVAVISDNEITLEYGNEYDTDEISDDVVLYSSKIVINKYDKNDTTKKLEGAEFVLYKTVEGVDYYYSLNADGKVEWLTVDAEDENLNTLDKVIEAATKAVTDENGEADFLGLANGTSYYLKEVKAPMGYALLKNPIEVDELNGIDGIGTQTRKTDAAVTGANLAQLVATEGVANAKASPLLPSTGGIGTTIFYCIGTVLVLGAVILLVVRRRMGAVDTEA